MPKLSIIILSYNTKDLTSDCLRSLIDQLKRSAHLESEIIVVDKGSADGSKEALNTSHLTLNTKHVVVNTIFNKENLGYPKGNNQGIKIAKGEYMLFLNSDVIVEDVDFDEVIRYMDKNKDIGALTVKVVLKAGGIDSASHRGFPSIWNAVCYFLKLELLFGRLPILNHIFGGYHLTYKDLNSIHEIDSPSGAFYLTRRDILEKIGGFDESFFMYGEDLDLSFRIKESGYKIIYFPKSKVIHVKYASGLQTRDETIRKQTRGYFFEAMSIFYKKNYQDKYPSWIKTVVNVTISIIKKMYV